MEDNTDTKTDSTKKMKSVISYQVFLLENKSKVQRKYPFLKAGQINGKLKTMWNSLSMEEKGKYRKFTLISTPTPPKKSPRAKTEKKKNSCKGRLLTPKGQKRNEDPNVNLQCNINLKAIADQYDGAMLGPYHDSDEEMLTVDDDSPEVSLFDDDELVEKPNDFPFSVPMHSNAKTYNNTRYCVQKDYRVPSIVTDDSQPTVTTSGILKCVKKQNRKSKGRVSFSTEDAEVKIMSSCSTLSASQEFGPTLDESPYNFDAIDKFEICTGTPEKDNREEKLSLKVRNESPLLLSNAKMPQKPKKAAKKGKVSPPAKGKRMLRSRSACLSTTGDVESGRGDADESFRDENAFPEKKVLDGSNKENNVSMYLLGGGDNQGRFRSEVSMLTDTPPSVDTSKVLDTAVLAPRKRRQQRDNDCSKVQSVRSNKQRRKEPVIQENQRSPRILTKSDSKTMKSTFRSGMQVKQKNDWKWNGNKKAEDVRLADENLNSFECGILDSSDISKWTSQDNFLKSKLNYVEELGDDTCNSSSSEQEPSPAMLQAKSYLTVAETLRGMKMVTASYKIPVALSEASDSPKLLSPTLSDISVLSSLSSHCGTENHGVTEPDSSQEDRKEERSSKHVVQLRQNTGFRNLRNRSQDLGCREENSSEACSEDQHLDLSQLSSLSSHSDCGTKNHGVIEPDSSQEDGKEECNSKHVVQLRQNVGFRNLRNRSQDLGCREENSSETCSEDQHLDLSQGKASGCKKEDLLCDMFQDLPPPEERVKSARRFLSSNVKDAGTSIPRFFQEEEIFG